MLLAVANSFLMWCKGTLQITGIVLLSFLMSACTSVPEGISPLKNFELNKYLGHWYEVARLDHSFEKGLSKVTADYSLRDDGGVAVTNRGYNSQTDTWVEANGKAYYVDSDKVAHLKVSFFGPFYASYVVFSLDKSDYQYAMVSGPNRDYLWILSRKKSLSTNILDTLVEQANSLGFATDKLIFVEQ